MERFMELYETVYRDLYRLAYYYLGNAEEAEDAVQDTALAAWEHFGKLKREESFRAWIFRILVNTCRKAMRKKSRREYLADEREQRAEGMPDPNLAERLELMELLSKLDEEERMIVTLSVFGGYKGEEIAEILERRHSTVRSRYRRALKKLERELRGKEEL
ncbi:MAG TPA: RNA polymerase sigma factor [Candidatus Merdisoma merdipullorum]|nr:RNA polymerase sigma factor [Candidatus Merdisoma merdipullorum]